MIDKDTAIKHLRRGHSGFTLNAGSDNANAIADLIESLSPKAELTDGVSLIAAERQRQIEQEGWTAEHDAQHSNGELATAAACYAMTEDQRLEFDFDYTWPWDHEWWKPTPEDRIRELVKAGALIAAEIDRLRAGRENP